jgi:hypothetical protein
MDSERPSAPRDAIRLIFTEKRSYTLAEAANLLGIDEHALMGEVDSGDVAASEEGKSHLPWKEVAYLALRTWPLKMIFEALGPDWSSQIPELLRPTTITTTLPSYQTRMLEVLAGYHQLDVSTFLQLHLLDLASAESRLLAERIPGFLSALYFPFGGEA